MMWIYCFLAFIVFLILLIIYLFTHKKTKGTKKPFRFLVWGVGILTIALFAAACILPADNQDESLSKQESTEYYRISTAINNGKFDHILLDIDKLFPPDKDLNSIRQTNRFMLLRLYYEKTGDTKKEKQLLTETSKNSEIMNDDVTKGIVEERLKELKQRGLNERGGAAHRLSIITSDFLQLKYLYMHFLLMVFLKHLLPTAFSFVYLLYPYFSYVNPKILSSTFGHSFKSC